MATVKISFTAESLRQLTCQEGKSRSIYYDKKQPKLACIVSKTGTKTFALHAFDHTRKKPIQFTIGHFPDITANGAREVAQKLLTELAKGIDILAAARSIREELTVDDIFTNWLIHAKNRLRTWDDSERLYILHVRPTFGKNQVSTVSPQQVRKWHGLLLDKFRQRKDEGEKITLSNATANRCLALLRAIFNQEVDHIDNPCNKVKAHPETSRDRFLLPDELKRFFTAIEDSETSTTLRDFVYLLLMTGARRDNVMSLRWSEIDFSTAILTIPAGKSKNKEVIQIPIVQAAMDILIRRKKETSTVFVFPGTGKTGHLVEPKRAWNTLVKRSGLDDLRLHDLRRTCGSYQAACGSNQAVISKSLGHKSIATTAIYTRFNLDPVRESMEKAALAMLSNAGKPEIMDAEGMNERSRTK